MPRPRQAHGRPGTRVIPKNWGASHARVVDQATQDASLVTIGEQGSASHWDEGLGRTVTDPVNPVYAGPASLMAVSDTARALVVVEDPTKVRVYEVTLPYIATVAVAVEQVITVDAGDADPMLAGRTLRVGHIERGSRRFSRVLLAILLD